MNTKDFVIMLGSFLGCGSSLVLAITFYMSFLNGHRLTINTNLFGEGYCEFFIFVPLYVVATLSSCVLILKEKVF